jgi:hypothetical protein
MQLSYLCGLSRVAMPPLKRLYFSHTPTYLIFTFVRNTLRAIHPVSPFHSTFDLIIPTTAAVCL